MDQKLLTDFRSELLDSRFGAKAISTIAESKRFPLHEMRDDVGILQLDDALVKLPVAGAEGGDLFIVFRPFSLELYNLRVHFLLLSERSGRRYAPVGKEVGLPIA